MLKHIPILLTPDLLRVMMEMGHGEELLLCDANYPAKSGAGERLYVTGCSIVELLEDILYYFPLDETAEHAATGMETCRESGRFDQYRALVEGNGSRLEIVERYDFYERARGAAARVVTTDLTRGGNIILKKGVVAKADLPSRHGENHGDGA